MADMPKDAGARRVRTALWVIAGLLGAVGIALSVAMSSWWPLLVVAGLAVPLMPLGRRNTQER